MPADALRLALYSDCARISKEGGESILILRYALNTSSIGIIVAVGPIIVVIVFILLVIAT